MQKKTNQSGMSMLYVLAALIVTGFISTALLKISSSDRLSNANYSTSATARSAAQSGIIAAVTELERDVPTTVDLLQNWINTPVKGPDTYIAGNVGALSYATELLAFDPVTFNVTIRSIGTGRAGSRASVVSVYHLDGLDYEPKRDWSNMDAIYIEDGVQLDFKGPIKVDGGIRLSSNSTFDAHANGSIFNGPFRVEDDLAGEMSFQGAYTFTHNAYFGTKPVWNRDWDGTSVYYPGHIKLEGKSGFPAGCTGQDGHNLTDQRIALELDDKSYWLESPTTLNTTTKKAQTWIDFKNNDIITDKPFITTKMTMKQMPSPINPVASLTKEKIARELDFSPKSLEVTINPGVIPASCIDIAPLSMSGDYFDSYQPTWHDFIVLKVPAGQTCLIGPTKPLAAGKKVIMLVEGKMWAGGSGKTFSVPVDETANPDHDLNSGHFTVVVMGNGKVNSWGGWSKFRGLYYRLGGEMIIGGALNTGTNNLFGGIYGKPGDEIQWVPDPGNIGLVTYDSTVYQDLDLVGDEFNGNKYFLTRSDEGPGSINMGTKLVASSIRGSLVSQNM